MISLFLHWDICFFTPRPLTQLALQAHTLKLRVCKSIAVSRPIPIERCNYHMI